MPRPPRFRAGSLSASPEDRTCPRSSPANPLLYAAGGRGGVRPLFLQRHKAVDLPGCFAGRFDLQVTPKENLREIEAALASGKTRRPPRVRRIHCVVVSSLTAAHPSFARG